jgi:hypothetical protein
MVKAVRITFNSTNTSIGSNPVDVYNIEWFGSYPNGSRNVEYYDRYKNAYFPSGISSTGYTTECNGYTPIIGSTNTIYAGSSSSAATITDLNNITRSGTYNGSDLTNAPVGGWIFIQHMQHSNTTENNWAQQIVTTMGASNTANQMYIRTKVAGTWSSWVQK